MRHCRRPGDLHATGLQAVGAGIAVSAAGTPDRAAAVAVQPVLHAVGGVGALLGGHGPGAGHDPAADRGLSRIRPLAVAARPPGTVLHAGVRHLLCRRADLFPAQPGLAAHERADRAGVHACVRAGHHGAHAAAQWLDHRRIRAQAPHSRARAGPAGGGTAAATVARKRTQRGAGAGAQGAPGAARLCRHGLARTAHAAGHHPDQCAATGAQSGCTARQDAGTQPQHPRSRPAPAGPGGRLPGRRPHGRPQPHAEPRLQPCDLHALVDGLCLDFAPGRIVCQLGGARSN